MEKLQQLQSTLTQHKLNDVERDKYCLEAELKAQEAVNSVKELRQINDDLCMQNIGLNTKVSELEA